MRSADGREQFASNPDSIPAIESRSFRDPNRRDPQALIPESRDRQTRVAFDAKTNTLVIGAYFIDKDRLNAEFKRARESRWFVKRIMLFVSQDCWGDADSMRFFSRNGFSRQEAFESGGTNQIALVKDIVPPKLIERMIAREWKSPFLTITTIPEKEAAPEPAPKVEEPEVTLSAEEIARLTPEEVIAEINKIEQLLGPRSADGSYMRNFESK